MTERRGYRRSEVVPRPIHLALSLVFLAPLAAEAETCIEPVKPEASYLHDAGYSGNEIHAEFEMYFREVEEFLNCWNQVTADVHEDARAAAYDLHDALRRYPSSRDAEDAVAGLGDFIASDAPMIDTGQLILSVGGQGAGE
ncbi:hypothetical protein [Alloyangia pacifica]|uniref:hypothetical protein n=1 Tax=Alloyangia pacifica TaxID=311180 RepID=UPI0011612A96|nr:hypothetical protein [Alloyangia pacifica]